MYKEGVLSISGYQGQNVPNRFYRQESPTQSLAFILPGFGYHADLPLLYYPGRIALNETMDILRLETAYNLRPAFTNRSDADQIAWLDVDTDSALDAALAQRSYQRLVVIGKSLGTMAMGHLLEHYPSLPTSRWIWLTPVLDDPRLVAQIQQKKPASLFAIGTKDHYYDEDTINTLVEATHGKKIVIPEANHSLEVPGSIRKSIQALGQVMDEVETFLKWNETG